MPVSEYFKGHGSKVLGDMKARYGEEKGESVFYATANKRKMNPENRVSKAKKIRRKA